MGQRHIDPAWSEDALATTGSATLRKRRLPADRLVGGSSEATRRRSPQDEQRSAHAPEETLVDEALRDQHGR
jgi:hypothetical protein